MQRKEVRDGHGCQDADQENYCHRFRQSPSHLVHTQPPLPIPRSALRILKSRAYDGRCSQMWLFMAVSHMSFSENPLNLRRKRMASEGKEENGLPPREHSSRNLPVPGEIQR